MSLLEKTTGRIGPLDEMAMAAARARQANLTKPPGSLGRLEEISVRIAGITGNPLPAAKRKAIIVMAGDHGIVQEGVSAYPQEVTPQMVFNFLRGGAAINVLARHVGARVVVVDVGVAAELEPHPDLVRRKIASGTANFLKMPAMSREQAVQSLEIGIEVFEAELAKGLDIVATGDMGIGNTTASTAIAAVFTGEPVGLLTGRGTGIGDEQLAQKARVIEEAIAFHRPDREDALDVLAKVGGFEIGGLAGVILGAAANRIPVVIDGFISGAAALIAVGLCPAAADYLIPAHNSVEIGHLSVLRHLDLRPLLNLELRLGEGTGAALAMSLVEASLKILDEMATFAEAGVSGAVEVEPSVRVTG
ncbi:MAG: nicotinate-nucleotide--dimethylbenzimidazole phosphoribosyltransferase [Dehalococcoidia bacterium]|nr:nicotinate-nucleotide--dimethylbenzimidazole phosphoribosyltransferase [Dehalococcoidia bacterium]